MKKVLIVSDSTRVGGIQKSLINMLNLIDYSKYDVSLLLFNDKNVSQINKNVKILPSNNTLRIIGSTSNELKKDSIFKFIKRKIISLLCRIFGSNFVFSLIYKKVLIKDEYDIAISYSNNVNSKSLYFGYNKFVIEKVKAKEKKCWIHVDYVTKEKDLIEEQEFKKMKEIILVSNACKKNFDYLYPEFKNKTTVVYNSVDKKNIYEMSNLDKVKFNKKVFNIISIGRLEKNKNMESQIIVAHKLKKSGMKFKWYVIGNGIDYLKIKNRISELDLEDTFILLGEKSNVYPYIKNSSLLVSTSLSESFGLTIAEALMLDIPVLALDYPALKEIVPKMCICNNLDDMYDKILLLMSNDKKYRSYKEKCVYKISDQSIKKQIDKVLGG